MHNLIESNARKKKEREKEANVDVYVLDEYCYKHISMIK
jgi:hypothetical protein